MIQTFLMMGRPGSGKGAQSKLLAEYLNAREFSSGGYYRELAKADSMVGHKIKSVLESGGLMPYWFSSYLFLQALFGVKYDESIVFEGAARTEPEAKSIDDVCSWLGRDYVVINLEVKEETVLERLLKRKGIENRADDNMDDIKVRFENYTKNTLPSIEYFRAHGKVIDIDGEPLPDVVFAEIKQKLGL